jgi:hypothetical protein
LGAQQVLIIAIAAAVLVAGVGFAAWFAYSESQNAAAQKLLAEAKGVADFQAVVDKFPRTMPAADALLRIAADERSAGNMEKSTAAFREFLHRFPKHDLAGRSFRDRNEPGCLWRCQVCHGDLPTGGHSISAELRSAVCRLHGSGDFAARPPD